MTTDTTGRAVALVAGVISALGGLGILLEDVATGSTPFELKHAIVIGIVALAILAGHSVTAAWRARSVFGVIGFFIVFVAATGLVVIKSTGRQAEHSYQSQAEADLAAEERARIKPLLAQAEIMLSGTAEKLDADCVHGKKSKGHCDGLRATLTVYTAAVTGHKADLSRLGPPKLAVPDAENFAEIAAVFGWEKAKVKAATVLMVPFLTTALFEFGAIVGFFFAFRQRAITETAPGEISDAEIEEVKRVIGNETPAIGAIVVQEDDNPGNPSNGGTRAKSKGEAQLDLTRRLASGETIPSQETIAEEWGVHPGTASKWLKEWRKAGLVPEAQRVGRCNRLEAV